jgi:hypothetical protein
MRRPIVILAFSFVFCGCDKHADQQSPTDNTHKATTSAQDLSNTPENGAGLKKLATGLEQPWPGSGFASMTMTIRESGGHPVLHCRLLNSGWKPLVINKSALPWKTPIFFEGTVVTSAGRTFGIAVTSLAYITGLPDPFSLGPNDVLEGDFELKYLPKEARAGPPLPRGEATLLLWSYSLGIYGDGLPQKSSTKDAAPMPTQATSLNGITYLPTRAMDLLGG